MIDNLLDRVNLAGFEDLQVEEPASQSVLNNAESSLVIMVAFEVLNESLSIRHLVAHYC